MEIEKEIINYHDGTLEYIKILDKENSINIKVNLSVLEGGSVWVKFKNIYNYAAVREYFRVILKDSSDNGHFGYRVDALYIDFDRSKKENLIILFDTDFEIIKINCKEFLELRY